MGLGAVAAATVGAGVLGAGASLIGSSKASSAANNAAALQQQQYQTTRGDLLPYNTTGQNALSGAYNLAQTGPTGGGPDYISQANAIQPGQMNETQLEATPGYQFDLTQGLQSTQSAAAARGLGVSGAALKGAATFATGLADNTYQNQFNVAQQRFMNNINLNTAQQGNLTNQFNRYNSIATLGENAGAQTGAQGTQAAATAGNYLNQAGLASAAGTQGVANAVTGAANSYLGYNALQQALNPTTGGYINGTQGFNPGSNNTSLLTATPTQGYY